MRTNKYFKFFLLLATAIVLSFSIGGEFLHSQIHHHQDQASHDQCFLYQLQTQVFILWALILLAAILGSSAIAFSVLEVIPSLESFRYILLRAPPRLS